MNGNNSIRVAVLCLGLALAGNSPLAAQQVTFQEGGVSLRDAFGKLESRSSYKIAYNNSRLDVNRMVTLDYRDMDVLQVLADLLQGTGYTYKVNKNYILIVPDEKGQQTVKRRTLTGVITDAQGEPIIGANVVEKGTTNGTITDMDGRFSLEVSDGSLLQVSYIGYDTQELPTSGKETLSIKLGENTQALDEVMVHILNFVLRLLHSSGNVPLIC